MFLFYNVLTGKSKIKHLSNRESLHEILFYDELSVVEISKAVNGYSRSYKIKIIDLKDQVEASKSSIKFYFEDLLNEMKGFKYQITVKLSLIKYRGNGDILFAPVYFNFETKEVINSEYNADTFQ